MKTLNEVVKYAQNMIADAGFTIVDKDTERPWGGFFVIEEQQAEQFIQIFFDGAINASVHKEAKLSPKILLVAPGKRLSWQYHYRRSEFWKVLEGPVGVVRSKSDKQGDMDKKKAGDLIQLETEERHRLVGLENWGIIAEIWQHEQPDHPSDEQDIVRLEDDFGR